MFYVSIKHFFQIGFQLDPSPPSLRLCLKICNFFFWKASLGQRGEAHVGGHDVGDDTGDGQPVAVLEQRDVVGVGVGAEAEEDHGQHHHRGRDQHHSLPRGEPHQDDEEQRPDEGQNGGNHTGQVLRHGRGPEVDEHLDGVIVYSELATKHHEQEQTGKLRKILTLNMFFFMKT